VKRVQIHLSVHRDNGHDERIKDSKHQQHLASVSALTLRESERSNRALTQNHHETFQVLLRIERKLEDLVDLGKTLRDLSTGGRTRTVAVGTQAGLRSDGEVTVRPDGTPLPRAVQQAELAAYAIGGAGMGIGDAFSRRADRKLERERIAAGKDIVGLKGEQALKQIKLQGGINAVLQNRAFNNKLRMQGIDGQQRLNLAGFQKTGKMPEPPTKDAQTQKVPTADMGVGTAPKPRAPEPPTGDAGRTVPEFRVNEGASTSTVPSDLRVVTGNAGPTVVEHVSHA